MNFWCYKRQTKLKYILHTSPDTTDEGDDEDSEEEDEKDATDGHRTNGEPVNIEHNDDSFLTRAMEAFIEKVSILKTRAGRAGLVHNFLRGLQLMAAPVPSGKSRWDVCLFVCWLAD